ncbi:hypothetical protein Taro_046674 [Colocasia esculenta]|uniref:peptidylprolyl isomerase n=1 Tax=Colocasia esculenta TaxID=4460 RepID=A0A843X7J7_COLES|nr:hypothetical protein [Colocasia esculenta]
MKGMASATASSAFLLPLGSGFAKINASYRHRTFFSQTVQRPRLQCCASDYGVKITDPEKCKEDLIFIGRRTLIGLASVASGFSLTSTDARGAGLPPEEKPKLCNDECEKELENVPMVTTESGLQYKDIKVGQGPSPPIGFQVVANYVAMVPSGQIFDSSLEKGLPYTFRVGSGQVIKGLDEGILGMKVGGQRRLYIPGSLAFPKGLNSAPGRPRVGANSPVVFDVSLEYIPGLETDEE